MKAFATAVLCAGSALAQPRDYPVKPVPFTAVHVDEGLYRAASRTQVQARNCIQVTVGADDAPAMVGGW